MVDRPFLLLVEWIRIKRPDVWRCLHRHALGEIGVLCELRQIRFADDRTTFHRPMILRASDLVSPVCGRELCANGEGSARRTQPISVITRAASHSARLRATVPERKADRVICLAGRNPDRSFDLAPSDLHLHDRHKQLVTFRVLEINVMLPRGLDAQQNHIFPGHLADRVRHFLEPAIVVVTAIIDAVIAMEDHFEVVWVWQRQGLEFF